MNSQELFFNNRYSVICNQDLDIEGFDFYSGDLQKIYLQIKNKELIEDRLYRGHIIVNSKDIEINKVFLYSILNHSLTDKNFYAFDIIHDGVDSICSIDDSIVFCSSWALPFYIFNYRTNNTLYGDIFARRLGMYKLKNLKYTLS